MQVSSSAAVKLHLGMINWLATMTSLAYCCGCISGTFNFMAALGLFIYRITVACSVFHQEETDSGQSHKA